MARPPEASRAGAQGPGPGPGHDGDGWRRELQRLAALLGGFIASSEQEFLAFGSGLQRCLERAGGLGNAARRALDAVSGEPLRGSLADFEAQTERLRQHSRRGAEVVEAMHRSLAEALGILAKIPAVDQDFQRSVRSLRALGVASQVESARLGAQGQGFTTLAAEVRRLAEGVREELARVLGRSRELEKGMGSALGAVLGAQRALQEELEAALAGLAQGFRELVAVNERAQGVSARMEGQAGHLATEVGEVVTSMQFQDITRQRLEHVRDSLELLRGELGGAGTGDGLPAPAAALAAAVAGLQRLQLTEAEAEFFSAVDTILRTLPALGGAAGALSDTCSELSGEGGASGSSFLAGLRGELAAVVATVRRAAERNAEVSGLLSSAARTAGEITSFIDGIDEIGCDIELIAINAIVQSSRTGAQGRPLAVIAKAIQRQSVDARRITGRVSGLLRQIGSAAEVLGARAREFSEAAQGEASGVIRELERLLQALEGADREFRDQVAGLRAETDRLAEDLVRAAGGTELHWRLRGLAEDGCGALERLAREAEARSADLDPADRAAVMEALAVRYTMESQRAVHRRLEGDATSSAPGAPEGDALGANVELF